MNILKVLGTVLKFAAPVATAVFVGPEAGAVVGGATLGGAAATWGGKRLEASTGLKLQKVAGPAAAVGGAAIAAELVGRGSIDQLCYVASQLCAQPDLLKSLVPAIIALLGFGIGDNMTKVQVADECK
jgi:hypothetical protein